MYFVINIISCDIRMNICNIAWLLYILRKEVLKLVDRKIIYFEDKEYPLELKRLKQPPQQLYVIGNTEGVTVIPKLGTVLGILESKWGFLILIVFPSLLAFIYEITVVFAEIKEGRNNKKEDTNE